MEKGKRGIRIWNLNIANCLPAGAEGQALTAGNLSGIWEIVIWLLIQSTVNSSTVKQLDSSTVRQLDSSTVRQLDSWTVGQLDS